MRNSYPKTKVGKPYFKGGIKESNINEFCPPPTLS